MLTGTHRTQPKAGCHLHMGNHRQEVTTPWQHCLQPQDDSPKSTHNSVLSLASIWSHQPSLAPLQSLGFPTKVTNHSIPQKGAISLANKANQDHQLVPLPSQSTIRLPGPFGCQFFFYQPQPSLPSRSNCPLPKLSKARPLATRTSHGKGKGS